MRKPLLAAVGLCTVAVLVIGNIASATPKGTFTAALVSDVGKFNDSAARASTRTSWPVSTGRRAKLGVQTVAPQSNSRNSDYLPNMVTAVH